MLCEPSKFGYLNDTTTSCDFTNETLAPYLKEYIRNHIATRQSKKNVTPGTGGTSPFVYVDMGHYMNRGRQLECLALALSDVTFIRIRRNRQAIAFSNVIKAKRGSPCMVDRRGELPRGFKHDGVRTMCPRSGEQTGAVELHITSDEVWDNMTSIQRWLWYADGK